MKMALGSVSCGDENELLNGVLGKERDPNLVEDRFRVDRRKLEHMLKAGESGTGQSGEDFFQEIMEQTSTMITWPSKLKIGAKSKKDPHIKIEGLSECVRLAKEKVMAVLDTKSSRVTLKMDVSHTDHSHIIGKRGENIKRVMSETGCHIHFPDSNRGSTVEKSNQVSIAGQPLGVECARQQIREILPLVLTFDLPHTGHYPTDATSSSIQCIAQTCNVAISFKLKPRMGGQLAIVRGSQQHINGIKDAIVKLVEHFTGNITSSVMVSMQLDVAPQHHLFIIGKNGSNIKQIMHSTGAHITFPDPNITQRKGAVFVSGSIQSVIHARAQLMNCLPLVLMFDLREEDGDVEQETLNKIMENYDVFLSVKPKPKQPSKSVIIKTSEKNAENMYTARQELLGLDGNENHASSTTYSMDSLRGSPSPTNLNLVGHYYGIPNHTHGPPPGFLSSATDGHASPPMFWDDPSSTSSSIPGVMGSAIVSPCQSTYVSCPPPPGLGPRNSSYSMSTIHSGTSGISDSANRPYSPPTESSSALLRSTSPPSGNPPQVVRTCSPIGQRTASPIGQRTASPIGAVGHQMSSPVAQRPNTSIGFGGPIARRRGSSGSSSPRSPTASPFTVEENEGGKRKRSESLFDPLMSSSSGNAVDSQNQCGTNPLSRRKSFEILPGTRNSSGGSLASESGELDRLGLSLTSSLLGKLVPDSPSSISGAEYDYMQTMASKAMEKKITNPELRTPTNTWSGLGFSKSMPGYAIKEMLAKSKGNMSPYNCPVNDSSSFFTSPSDSMSPSVIMYESPGESDSPEESPIAGASSGVIGTKKSSVSFAPSICKDLEHLFKRVGFADKYLTIFEDQEVDLQTFLTLSEEDLKELGVKAFGPRKKMLNTISDLKSKLRNPEPQPSASSNSGPFSENSFNTPLHRFPVASHSEK